MLDKMFKKLNRFVDHLFPRRCDYLCVQSSTLEDLADRIKLEEVSEGITALFDYRDSLIRSFIWEFKFHTNEKALSLLAKIFSEVLIDEIQNLDFSENDKLLLVPIPSPKSRLKERGCNPVELLTNIVLKDLSGFGFEDGKGVLWKKRETKRQTEIENRKERIENVKDSFGTSGDCSSKKIFLIDDIVTTGATLGEAKKALLQTGAKEVRCFALAH